MGAGNRGNQVVIPSDSWRLISVSAILATAMSFSLNSRTSDFGTLAAALGLYSAGLLGVFSVLVNWRMRMAKRRPRDLHVGDEWAAVVDRSVKRSLSGSTLAFALMVFGVLAPAFQGPVHQIVPGVYPWVARTASALVIGSIVLLAGSSLQTVKDLKAVYAWIAQTAEDDAIEENQATRLVKFSNY